MVAALPLPRTYLMESVGGVGPTNEVTTQSAPTVTVNVAVFDTLA